MNKTVWIVHQYASTPASGIGGRHFYLAEELARLGYRVYVIAASANHLLHTQPKLSGDVTIEKVGGFHFVWIKMPGYTEAHSKQRAINWFLFPWKIQKLARLIADKPDAVLCSSPSLIAFLGAQRLANKFNARLIFEVRDIWPLTLTEIGGLSVNHPFIRIMQWVERRAYRDADRVVSNLKNSVEHMVCLGLQRQKFYWIPNGFSRTEVEQQVRLNEQARRKLPKEKFIVGYTGTLGVANALDVLLEAASRLRTYSDIAFVLVGHGKEKEQLKQQARALGLKTLYFIDPIPKVEIQSILQEFDACYIGWRENELYRFGIGANKIPEYLFSRKPIIHSYSGACEPVKECGAGLLVPAENPQAVADAILQLYRLPQAERDRLGENGRREAEETYEYSQLARRLETVLFG
ncbi:glycosyltransferase family 4 protein [Pseudomonas sp. NPDC047963]